MENEDNNKISENKDKNNETISDLIIPKIGIFIDEANIYHSQKTLGWQVDYLKLKNYFEKMGEVNILNFYTSFQKQNEKQNKFLIKIKEYGYVVFSKKLKIIRTGSFFIKKGNLDIELAVDAYRLKDKYDTFVLFSGDSDFEYLLRLLKEKNKKIIVFSTASNISRELIKISDEYHELKKLRDSLEYITEIK